VEGHNKGVAQGTGTARVWRDDFDLARRCVSGDTSAQRELFRSERRRVHATLYRVLGSNSDIDDLLQDAFIEIFRSIPSFRGEASLGTWLDRITVRVAFAYLTKRRVETVRLSVVPEPSSHAPGADERAMTREAAVHLYQALDRVPVSQRVAFALHVLDGRPIKDVAGAMTATVVATKVRIWRTWRALHRAAARDPLLADLVSVRARPSRGAGRDAEEEAEQDEQEGMSRP
jgi:RNA polymerase sigma-70 factor (ECF subfamily)